MIEIIELKRRERRERRERKRLTRFWSLEREKKGFESFDLGFGHVLVSSNLYPFEKKDRGSILYALRGVSPTFGDARS